MVKYELYINGQLCDLSEDSEVSLIYKSPLFTELDAIQSNTSVTLELPMTAKNRKIVGYAMRPDILQDEPYIKLPAELYANGVDIFRRGFAVIDEITDVISTTLIFGNIENFEALRETELREIEMEGNESIPWNSQTLWGDRTDAGGVEYIRADFGAGVVNSAGETTGQAASMEYARPSVGVPAVIEAIEKACNVNLRFDPEYFDVANLWVPITDDKPNAETPAVTTVGIRGYFFVEQNGVAYYSEGCIDTAGVVETNGSWDYINVSEVQEFIFKYRIQIPERAEMYGQQYIYLYLSDTYDIDNTSILVYQKTGDAGSYVSEDVIIKTEGKRFFIIRVYGNHVFESSRNQVNGTFSVIGEFPDRKILYPIDIPVPQNLPDQTCAEFLQNLMNMFGVFAQAEGENTVRLIHPSMVYKNIEDGNICDWSQKLVINGDGNEVSPDGIRFYIDDWAQVTTIDYDNDEEVKEAIDGGEPKTEGRIVIDNKNIEEEGEVNIDFSASIMKEQHMYGGAESTKAGVAVVPIWEAEEPDSDGNVEYRYSDVSPRILMFEYDADDPDMSRLTFPETLRFGGKKGLVARYYGDLKKMTDRAKVITVRIRLSPLDLRDLDFIKPVYLKQFGCYFAIYEINTSETGISEVQLIKL